MFIRFPMFSISMLVDQRLAGSRVDQQSNGVGLAMGFGELISATTGPFNRKLLLEMGVLFERIG